MFEYSEIQLHLIKNIDLIFVRLKSTVVIMDGGVTANKELETVQSNAVLNAMPIYVM